MLVFHAVGEWSPDQVFLTRRKSSWRSNATIDEQISLAWNQASARLGNRLFDGPMCRLESWTASADRLEIALSQTSYRLFLGTNLTNPDLADEFGRTALANPVGVSPALETADGWLMMGRRNATVAYYPDRVHPFAGALEPGDENVFLAIRRELREELGFVDVDIAEIFCTGIAEDVSIRQPELIFRARSFRTRAQIEKQIDTEEHHDALSIPATEAGVGDLLCNSAALTPVAVASLLLWGRLRFGATWWNHHSARHTAAP